ncbi:hypothetical protein M2436_005161 [Streptomyces sp. HB372]|nr:hypothetical protein [Streptomyces sp. HB372]
MPRPLLFPLPGPRRRTVSPFQCAGARGRLRAATEKEGRYGLHARTAPLAAVRLPPFAGGYFTARTKVSEGDAQTARASPKPEASRVRACQSAEGMSPSACSP